MSKYQLSFRGGGFPGLGLFHRKVKCEHYLQIVQQMDSMESWGLKNRQYELIVNEKGTQPNLAYSIKKVASYKVQLSLFFIVRQSTGYLGST